MKRESPIHLNCHQVWCVCEVDFKVLFETPEPNPPQLPPGLVLGRVNCIDMGRRFYFLRQGSSLVLIRVLSRADARPIEVARIAIPENRKIMITATSIAELARFVHNGSRWRIYCPRADGCIVERNGRHVVSERSRSSLEHSRRGRWLALRFQHISGRHVQIAYLVDLGTARVYQLELPRDAIGQLAVVGAPSWVDGTTAWANAPPCELFFDTETEGELQRRVYYTTPPPDGDATNPIAPTRISEL